MQRTIVLLGLISLTGLGVVGLCTGNHPATYIALAVFVTEHIAVICRALSRRS